MKKRTITVLLTLVLMITLATPAVYAGGLLESLRDIIKAADQKSCVGVDIGGSDIKLAASVKGKLLLTKEYDWNPASSPTAEGIIDPILELIREAKERIEEDREALTDDKLEEKLEDILREENILKE